MRHASSVQKLARLGDPVVGSIAVGNEDAAVVLEQAHRDRACPGGVIIK